MDRSLRTERVQEAGDRKDRATITSPGQGCHLAARTAIEAKLRIINVCVGSLMDRGLPFEHVECGSSCERVIRSFFARYNVLATPGCGIIKSPLPPPPSLPLPLPSLFYSRPSFHDHRPLLVATIDFCRRNTTWKRPTVRNRISTWPCLLTLPPPPSDPLHLAAFINSRAE